MRVLQNIDHALTSYKKKDELLSIAGALQISDKGTIADLLSRIRLHMQLHPKLRENPRFAGLFLQVHAVAIQQPHP